MTACAQAKKAAAVNEKKTAKYLEGFKKASAALKKTLVEAAVRCRARCSIRGKEGR